MLKTCYVLIKGLKSCNVKFSKHASYEKRPVMSWNQKSHFSNTGKILLKQEFSDRFTNIHEHKRYYYTFDNSLLFTESIRNIPSFHASNRNQFLPCQHRERWHNTIRVRAKPVCIVLIIPGHPAEKFPVRAVDIVNPGIQWRFTSHLTYINKY